MTSLNERAWTLVEKALIDYKNLDISSLTLSCGCRVVDMGIASPGGLAAGLEMARIGMAGLGEPALKLGEADEKPWLWVTVTSDHPLEGCFISQAAHWPVQVGAFRGMGSGPACLLNRALDPGKKFGYSEEAARAVLVLEAATLPDDETCRKLAADCDLPPERLAVVAAPTSCLVGSVQIAARSVETALHKMAQLGFDLRKVVSAAGQCPLAAPAGDDLIALGKTNDVMMFGSQVWLAIKGADEVELEDLVRNIPSSVSPSYGEPFLQTLKKAGGFYNIDPGLFAPAEITLTSLDAGRVYHAGAVDSEKLGQVFKQ